MVDGLGPFGLSSGRTGPAYENPESAVGPAKGEGKAPKLKEGIKLNGLH